MRKIYLTLAGLAMTYLGFSQCTEIESWAVSPGRIDRTWMSLQFYSSNYEEGKSTGGDDTYTIEYGVKGFSVGAGIVDSYVPDEAWTYREFNGLTMETTYEFYVKEQCDAGETSLAGPFEFTTDEECSNKSGMWATGVGTEEIEVCMSTVNNGGTFRVQLFDATGTTLLSTVEGNTHPDVCEGFSGLTAGTNYMVRMKEFCSNGDSSEVVENSAMTPDVCAEIRYFGEDEVYVNSLLMHYEVFAHQVGESFSVEYGPAPLTPGSGQNMTVPVNSTDSSFSIEGLNADTQYDVILTLSCASGSIPSKTSSVRTAAECQEVDLDGGVAFHDKINFYFEAVQIGQQYTLIYGPQGFDASSAGTSINGTIVTDANMAEITGLSEQTTYDIYVFAACAGGVTDTVGPETVTTKEYVVPPANDACVNAITLSLGATMGSNSGSTGNDRPTVCMDDITQQSTGVWYRFTPAQSAEYVLDLCSPATDFDSQIEIFTGTCPSLSCLADEDDDDNCGNAHPTIEQSLSQGTTYYLYVSGYDYETGGFELEVSQLLVGLAENGEDNKYISNSQNGDVYLNGFSDLSENNVRVFSVDGTTTNFTIEDSKLLITDKGVYVIEITDGKIYREKVIVE